MKSTRDMAKINTSNAPPHESTPQRYQHSRRLTQIDAKFKLNANWKRHSRFSLNFWDFFGVLRVFDIKLLRHVNYVLRHAYCMVSGVYVRDRKTHPIGKQPLNLYVWWNWQGKFNEYASTQFFFSFNKRMEIIFCDFWKKKWIIGQVNKV